MKTYLLSSSSEQSDPEYIPNKTGLRPGGPVSGISKKRLSTNARKMLSTARNSTKDILELNLHSATIRKELGFNSDVSTPKGIKGGKKISNKYEAFNQRNIKATTTPEPNVTKRLFDDIENIAPGAEKYATKAQAQNENPLHISFELSDESLERPDSSGVEDEDSGDDQHLDQIMKQLLESRRKDEEKQFRLAHEKFEIQLKKAAQKLSDVLLREHEKGKEELSFLAQSICQQFNKREKEAHDLVENIERECRTLQDEQVYLKQNSDRAEKEIKKIVDEMDKIYSKKENLLRKEIESEVKNAKSQEQVYLKAEISGKKIEDILTMLKNSSIVPHA